MPAKWARILAQEIEAQPRFARNEETLFEQRSNIGLSVQFMCRSQQQTERAQTNFQRGVRQNPPLQNAKAQSGQGGQESPVAWTTPLQWGRGFDICREGGKLTIEKPRKVKTNCAAHCIQSEEQHRAALGHAGETATYVGVSPQNQRHNELGSCGRSCSKDVLRRRAVPLVCCS